FTANQERLLDAALRESRPSGVLHPSKFSTDSEKLKSSTVFYAKVPIIQSLRKVRENNKAFRIHKVRL
ncbi:hypothetical protein L218DRAFT_955969, partial [Marasmius fiardii PR-910]